MKMESFDRVFDTIEDFASTALAGNRGCEIRDGWRLLDLEGCVDMAFSGWAHGGDRARAFQLEVVDYIESLGLDGLDTVESYDVSGAFVDVGAFCEGEPECMVEYEEQMMPRQRVVRIFAQVNHNSYVESDQMVRRGVAICGLVDALENHGLRCEVWGVDSVRAKPETGRPRLFQHAVCLKKADQPLALDRLVFAVAHPAFFFGILASARTEMHGFSFGRAMELDESTWEHGEIYFPMPNFTTAQQWRSDAAALELVVEKFTGFLKEELS